MNGYQGAVVDVSGALVAIVLGVAAAITGTACLLVCGLARWLRRRG